MKTLPSEDFNRNLDDMLSEVTEKQIIQLDLNLKGYEVYNAEEVEALVNRIRERLLAELKENTRVRII